MVKLEDSSCHIRAGVLKLKDLIAYFFNFKTLSLI